MTKAKQNLNNAGINARGTLYEVINTELTRTPPEVNPQKTLLPIDYTVIAKGSPEEIHKLAQEYNTKEFRALMLTTTCHGNNPLHLAAQFNTPEAIAMILKLMGEESNTLAVQANVEGLAPALLLNKNKGLAATGKYSIAASLIVPITKNAPTSELSSLIDINKLFSERYPHLVTGIKKDNLKWAAEAVNDTRKKIHYSPSHMAVNMDGTKEKQEQLKKANDELNSLRQNAATAALLIEYVIKAKIANCGELAEIMYVYFREKEIASSSEIVYLNNADHVFNVIGRTPGSNLNDPATWGDNAVIADAWSGEVYSASELPSRLKGFRCIQYKGENHYYLEPYNPRFHKFTVIQTSYSLTNKVYELLKRKTHALKTITTHSVINSDPFSNHPPVTPKMHSETTRFLESISNASQAIIAKSLNAAGTISRTFPFTFAEDNNRSTSATPKTAIYEHGTSTSFVEGDEVGHSAFWSPM